MHPVNQGRHFDRLSDRRDAHKNAIPLSKATTAGNGARKKLLLNLFMKKLKPTHLPVSTSSNIEMFQYGTTPGTNLGLFDLFIQLFIGQRYE